MTISVPNTAATTPPVITQEMALGLNPDGEISAAAKRKNSLFLVLLQRASSSRDSGLRHGHF
jgi:hypothetical protein